MGYNFSLSDVYDEEAMERKRRACEESLKKKRHWIDQIEKGTEPKNLQLPTKTNPKAAGSPSLLDRKDIWEVIHEHILEYGYNKEVLTQALKEAGFNVKKTTVQNWHKGDVRDFRKKIKLLKQQYQLGKMLKTAIENEEEVLGITFEEAMQNPKILAVRQKATEHVLDTLGKEHFNKEPSKTKDDKNEQMLRMRLMLQKLSGETPQIEEPVIYDIDSITTGSTESR
jgi:hypothetical protein